MTPNFFTNHRKNARYKKFIGVFELMILGVKPKELLKDKK
jgi:hypothetical protein